MADTQKTNRLVIAAILTGLFAFGYSALQPKLRLRVEMPKDFIDDSKSLPPAHRAQEERLARAYWQCARTVQWQYGYGRLPDEPPPEFLVTSREAGTAAADTGSRTRYWHRLHGVWYVASNWEKTYTLDLSQLNRGLQSAGTRLELWLRGIIGASW